MKNKICKITGCEKPHLSLGYCSMHYQRMLSGKGDMRPETLVGQKWKIDDPRREAIRKGLKKYWENRKTRKCALPNCNKKHYAKGFCRTHYNLNRFNGEPEYKKNLPKPKCKVENCHKISKTKGFCKFHYNRYAKGIELTKPKGNHGELNNKWSGGYSQYPNHYEMKKNRLIVLKKSNYICCFCGGKANCIHHLDFSKDNHDISNLVASCHKCNTQKRNGDNRRYLSTYGMPAKKIAKKMGISLNKVRFLHDNNALKKCSLYISKQRTTY
ncbi:MAG: hypothetical protein ABIK30_05645 [bacterium]